MAAVAALAALACIALAPMPASALTLFGLVNTGELYASSDSGATWTVRGTLPVHDAVALAAGTSSTQLMMASGSGTFYRSTDAGVTWTASGVVPASDVSALISYPGRVLLLTRSGSIYSSLDNGTTWTGIGVMTASDVVGATRFNQSIFALTQAGSVYRSNDNGASWTPVGAITISDAVQIAPLGPNLFVLTSTGDIWRSADSGVSWAAVSTLSQSGMTGLTVATSSLVATTEAGEIAASANGTTWTWRGIINQVRVIALATDIPTGTSVPQAPVVAVRFLSPRPNPASSVLQLAFDLDEASAVTVRLYDARGRRVGDPIVNEVLDAGSTLRSWHPSGLPAGQYLLRATIGGRDYTQKLVYLSGR